MKNQMKFVSVLLCLCMCLCCVSCNTKPKAEISFLSRAEAGLESASNGSAYVSVPIFYEVEKEHLVLKYLDAAIVVATVIGHEGYTQTTEKSPYRMGFSAVAHIVEITDVLLGDCKIGEKMYVCITAQEKDGVYYAADETEYKMGGFIEKGTQILLFAEKNEHHTAYYGENFKHHVVIPTNSYSSTRIVNEDGTLGYLEGSRLAKEAAFAQYHTVEEVRAALPQIFETYRDAYKTDYSLIDTYRASPGAAPAAPENYVYYADLPK